MAEKPSFINQSKIIDDHNRGTREQKIGIKIHQIFILTKAKYPVKGVKQEVRIRIPINTDREISVETKNDKKKSGAK